MKTNPSTLETFFSNLFSCLLVFSLFSCPFPLHFNLGGCGLVLSPSERFRNIVSQFGDQKLTQTKNIVNNCKPPPDLCTHQYFRSTSSVNLTSVCVSVFFFGTWHHHQQQQTNHSEIVDDSRSEPFSGGEKKTLPPFFIQIDWWFLHSMCGRIEKLCGLFENRAGNG